VIATWSWHEWTIQKNEEKLQTPADVGFATVPEKWKGKSIGDWTAEIEANPKDARLVYNRAMLHIARRDYGEAFRDLSDAIALNPNFAEAYAERSIAHLALNNDDLQYTKALEDANKAIELQPNFARGYYARAFTSECMEQNEQAIKDSLKAIELGERGSEVWDTYINVYENISLAYQVMGRYDEAQKIIVAGSKVVDPKYKWLIYRQSALIHYMKQEFKQALDDLVLATKESNCGPTVWSLMACCYLNLGQQPQAEEACFQGSRDAGVAPSFRRRAEYWRLNGKIDKAIEDMGRAINLDRSKYYSTSDFVHHITFRKGNSMMLWPISKSLLRSTQVYLKLLACLLSLKANLAKQKKRKATLRKRLLYRRFPPSYMSIAPQLN
jgi:tetratricopeptide (TPR) repeat protein